MLDGFSTTEFTALDQTKTVYRRGSGPGVLIMTEIPGITPSVLEFAERVANEGLSVALRRSVPAGSWDLGQPHGNDALLVGSPRGARTPTR